MYPNLETIGALIGERARASMLFALLDGREMAARDLALAACCSPQSASAHLHKLVRGGLLRERRVGRNHLFCLASSDVAFAIETLASVAPPGVATSLSQNNRMQRIREARSCYDHLAGKFGVRLTDALSARGLLVRDTQNREFAITADGEAFFKRLGIDLEQLRMHRRTVARACMDWTERRHHLAGSLGAALMHHFLLAGWVRRHPHDRSLSVTPTGSREFQRLFLTRELHDYPPALHDDPTSHNRAQPRQYATDSP